MISRLKSGVAAGALLFLCVSIPSVHVAARPPNECRGALLGATATDNDACKRACNLAGGRFGQGDYLPPPGWGGYCPGTYCNQRAPCCCAGRGQAPADDSVPGTDSIASDNCDSGPLTTRINCKLGKAQGETSLKTSGLASVVGGVIKTLLGLLGIVYLIMIIYAGFQWLTAQGDEKKVGAAIGTVNHAIFGLVIVVAAYSITVYIINGISGAVK